jgi:hypothetical protein
MSRQAYIASACSIFFIKKGQPKLPSRSAAEA